MSAQDRLIDTKISILQLATELGNISKACKTAGIARSSFYDIKKAYEQFGRAGLEIKEKTPPKMPNEFSEEIVEKVLDMTRQHPSYSYQRIGAQLNLLGIGISGSGVRNIWMKRGLNKRIARFLWLEKEVSEGRGILTEKTIRSLKRLKRINEATDQHIDVNSPGELLSQDLYFVGCIKGVGRIYMQSVVDCSSSVGFAKLCVNKMPMTSVAVVHEKVIPFYDEMGIDIKAILTDCGREYCGLIERHPFELYLAAQNIKHKTTRPASPFTNGFVERFHQTVKNEFFAKAFREKIYTTVDELQIDLDKFILWYNTERAHSGYRCQGRTPMGTFISLLEESQKTETQQAA